MQCTLADIAPFEYNFTVSKSGYENSFMTMKVSPRRSESIFIELEKKVRVESIDLVAVEETAAQKIKRLREENLYYARFQLAEDDLLIFITETNQLRVQYRK